MNVRDIEELEARWGYEIGSWLSASLFSVDDTFDHATTTSNG